MPLCTQMQCRSRHHGSTTYQQTRYWHNRLPTDGAVVDRKVEARYLFNQDIAAGTTFVLRYCCTDIKYKIGHLLYFKVV